MATRHWQQRRKKVKRKRKKYESFGCLFVRVGGIVLACGWITAHCLLWFSSNNNGSKLLFLGKANRNYAGDSSTFPVFNIDPEKMENDAFGIFETLSRFKNTTASIDNNIQQKFMNFSDFYNEVLKLRKEFTFLYGGENAARYLIHSGVTTFHPSGASFQQTNQEDIFDFKYKSFPSGLKHTAIRLLEARKTRRPFKISFGGYSVTVGRGNYFHQSYPFVMERLLKKPMALLGIELEVRNSAIGGVPSFPYGWCLGNFLGDDADVISWDFSMNEPGGVPDGLEAYIRHGVSMERRPMLIVKDTSTNIAGQRRSLLQNYTNSGTLIDAIVLSIEDSLEPILTIKEEILPSGFREWRKFGAPKDAPGQTRHHPGVKEHELLGWLLTMHFLAALELVALAALSGKVDKSLEYLGHVSSSEQVHLPPPLYGRDIKPSEIFSLLYGQRLSTTSWKMNSVHCRTSYDPILKNNLQDIVVAGSLGEDIDIMLPRGSQLYNSGWVLDLGEGEKKAKKKLERYGGLGYIDSKKAYYGIHASGPLLLFIPCLDRFDIWENMQKSSGVAAPIASECFKNLVVCEVNEKHTGNECSLSNEMSFHVGGVNVEKVVSVNATGTSYWGRNICLSIEIPPDALLSERRTSAEISSEVGLFLEIVVASTRVITHTAPCSISHVIWEQVDDGASLL